MNSDAWLKNVSGRKEEDGGGLEGTIATPGFAGSTEVGDVLLAFERVTRGVEGVAAVFLRLDGELTSPDDRFLVRCNGKSSLLLDIKGCSLWV